MVTEDTRTTA